MTSERIVKPDDFEPGDRVAFVPWSDADPSAWEYGEVTSTNRTFVFVRYDGEKHAKATYPGCLVKGNTDA